MFSTTYCWLNTYLSRRRTTSVHSLLYMYVRDVKMMETVRGKLKAGDLKRKKKLVEKAKFGKHLRKS